MKVPALFLSLAFAAIAAAQGNDGLPDCAKSCADGFLQNGIGSCANGDVKCICENKSFLGDIACCLVGKCEKPDQSSAVAYASRICVAFHVTGLPTSVSCTATPTTSPTTSPSISATGTPTATPTGTPTGTPTEAATGAAKTSSTSGNYGPRQTAQAGLGVLGGIVAAAIML